MIAILMATELSEKQAVETTDAVLADPQKYGFRSKLSSSRPRISPGIVCRTP